MSFGQDSSLVNLSSAFKKVVLNLSKVLTWISGCTIFALMFLVSLDVWARYVLKQPIKGVMDIGEMMLVIIAFLGMSYTQVEKGHVRVEVLVSKLSSRTQAVLDTISSLFSAIVFALISWNLGGKVLKIMDSPEVGPQTDLLFIPHAPFIFVAAFGSFLLCLVLVVDVCHNYSKIKQG